jgi:hypothetical protein
VTETPRRAGAGDLADFCAAALVTGPCLALASARCLAGAACTGSAVKANDAKTKKAPVNQPLKAARRPQPGWTRTIRFGACRFMWRVQRVIRSVGQRRKTHKIKRLRDFPQVAPSDAFGHTWLTLSRHPFGFAVQLVQRGQIGLGRSHHNVGVSAYAIDDAAPMLQPHRHLTLRFGAAGRDGVD